MINIWTDGSSKGLNAVGCGRGGWAYLIEYEDGTTEMNSGSINNTTNQRMELLAAFNALRHTAGEKIQVYTDSAYLLNCWKDEWWKKWQQNGWQNSKKESVANRDLWEQLIPYFKDSRIKFIKVKGHSGQYNNEVVDKLANAAADSLGKI